MGEHHLRGSDELAALIVRSATDFGIVTNSPNGIITSWSPGAEKLMGWTAAEAVGQPVDLFFTPEDRAEQRPQIEMAQARADGCATDERWHLKRDGSRFWASGELQPLREEGEIVGFVKILRDRTEARGMQERLVAAEAEAVAAREQMRSDEQRLRELFQAAPGFIAVLSGADHVFELANASYRQLVGHRDVLGKPVREALPEVEGQGFFELLDRVYATGERVTLIQTPIMLQRSPGGEPEQRFVTVLYEAMRDESGAITGIFVEGFDATDAAQARLAAEKVAAEQKAVLSQLVEGVIATDAAGRISFVNEAAERLLGPAPLDAAAGDQGGFQILDEGGAPYPPADLPLSRAMRQGETVTEVRFRVRRPDGGEVLAVGNARPVMTEGKQIGAVLTVRDETERVGAEAALREETRALETLNRVFADVAGELDLERVVQMVTDAGREISGAQFGAFFYNRATEQGDMLLYTLSGIERSAFERFGMPRATAIFHPTLSGEGVLRSDDITTDARYGLSAPHHGMPEGHVPVRSYLAVPVVSRSGEAVGGLFYGHREPGRFDERHERLLVGIAGQAATAIDNARLFEAAQREIARRKAVEERREFLLDIGDRLRVARTVRQSKLAAAEALGGYLGVARAGYGQVDESGERVHVATDWTAGPHVASLAGESRILDSFGPEAIAELRTGRTLVVRDCLADRRAGQPYAETWNSIGCCALVVVPLVRDGCLRAILYLHEPGAREWTADEVSLAEEVAARTWDAVARARAEDALRASEARYRTLFEAIDAGFCVLEMMFDERGEPSDYRFLEINPAFEKQSGLSNAVGRSIRELAPDTDQSWVDLYADVARSRRPARHENFFPALDRWFDVYAYPLDAPEAQRVAVLFNDVSERKRAELRLTELNRTLEARVAETVAERDMIWRTSQDLFVVCGFDGFYRSANPAWLDALGYAPEELVGSRFDALVHPDDVEGTHVGFNALLAGEVINGLDLRMKSNDGAYRWFSWTCVPQGDVFYASGRDVTQRKELEDQLRQSQKMEAVGQLTGGIAHDFNNLLTIVSGNIEMARRALGAEGDARAVRLLGNAMKGADRAAALTQRLLAFSRRQPLQPRATDINKLIVGMTELLDRALGETIDLQVVAGAGLWRVEVDPNQLENAILNLAVNARDAMPGGGKLTVETTNAHIDDAYAAAQREVAPGQYVLVSVTDTGEGMPPDIVAKAFDPFFSTKEVGKGTGLGLSQVYGYVKQSGGHVKIYSEPGQGTTVKMYLPRLIADMHGAEEEAPLVEAPIQGRESILVVEDDDDVRIFTVDSLRELGYRVLEAHDGASALRLLERQDEAPYLLLTDVVMPGMSGRELAEQARATYPEMQVLYTTGYARNAIVHGGRLDPGVELLPKPFTFEALAAKVRAVIEKAGVERALVVDPGDALREDTAGLIAELGFAAEEAATVREALGKLRAADGGFDVVLVSDAIPVGNLAAVLSEIHAVRAGLPVLIYSPAAANALAAQLDGAPCVGVIAAPFDLATLRENLRALRVRCAAS